MIDIQMNVASHEKIHVAVAIIVAPRRTHTESTGAQARFCSYILKFTVAYIAIQDVSAEASYIKILQAVVVEVRNSHAHPPSFSCESGRLRNVSKLQACALVVESHHEIAAVAITLHAGTVHRNYVQLSVVVAIDKSNAAAHRFHNVFLVGRRNVWDGYSSLRGDVFEPGDGGLVLRDLSQACSSQEANEGDARQGIGKERGNRQEARDGRFRSQFRLAPKFTWGSSRSGKRWMSLGYVDRCILISVQECSSN